MSVRVTLFAYHRHCNGRLYLRAYTSEVSTVSGEVVGIGFDAEVRGMPHWTAFIQRWLQTLPSRATPDIASVQQCFFTERKPYVIMTAERDYIEEAVSSKTSALIVDYWKHERLLEDVQARAQSEGRWTP
jgi:hypothetical protein